MPTNLVQHEQYRHVRGRGSDLGRRRLTALHRLRRECHQLLWTNIIFFVIYFRVLFIRWNCCNFINSANDWRWVWWL